MRKKLRCILLIDDDEPTNFLNELVINKLDCADKVVALQSGREALDYLQSEDTEQHPRPDLIFLDINMPGMNRWEFIHEYRKLEDTRRAQLLIVMLTTSLNPDDEAMARGISEINEFRSKPLTTIMVDEILRKYFSAVYQQ